MEIEWKFGVRTRLRLPRLMAELIRIGDFSTEDEHCTMFHVAKKEKH